MVKASDYELRQRLGTRQRSPRWAFAWKFRPREEVTRLEDIVVQVGRTGMLTPVALLEPVDVGGVSVSRATLHNEGELRKKDIRRGDKVRLQRAGDVIPEVVGSLKRSGSGRAASFSMPRRCPVCGAEVYKEGAYYFCPASLSCRAQLVGRIIHYASREAMNIEGLGEETVRQLVDREMVREIADLYRLSTNQLEELDGFARKSAGKLYAAIQSAKKTGLDRFLYAMGIRHVGQRVARILARRFTTLEKIQNAGRKELKEIPEIGAQIADSIVDFFRQDRNRQALKNLFDAGIRIERPQAKRKGRPSLRDKTFVFTGGLDNYTRSEAEERVEELGARTASSVSGNTDYVVAGSSPGSKMEQARKKNVKVIDEKEFENLLQN